LANLRVERGELRLRRPQRVLRLIEFLSADRASLDERVEALQLLGPVLNVGFDARAVGLGAAHRGLLAILVDLYERRPDLHSIA
jgi:hypothetical protein